MIYIILFLCFIIFLYSFYILVKDDYIFIRKNIALDQLFDFAVTGIIGGLIIARIIFFIFNPLPGNDYLGHFFSSKEPGVTLKEVVSGNIIAFYLLAKYKKYPMGRLFDFLMLALLTSLPLGYLLNIFSVNRKEILHFIFVAVIYIVINFIFWKYLLKRMLNNNMKEGSLGSLFLIIYSGMSILATIIYKFRMSSLRQLEPGDVLLIIILAGSILIYMRNERKKLVRKKT